MVTGFNSTGIMNKYTPLFIWLLMCFIFLIIKSGCSPPTPSVDPIIIEIIPEQPFTYNIVETNGIAHRYEENIFELNLPLDNPKLTQFCLLHTSWEHITVIYQGGAEGYVVNRITP